MEARRVQRLGARQRGSPRAVSRPVSGLAVRLGAGLSLLGLTLGACIVEERNYDPQLAVCTDYCGVVENQCQGEFRVYDRTEACMSVCQLMPAGGDNLGNSANTNTVACRTEKLQQTEFDRNDCPQVGPSGGGSCGSDCEAFCLLRQQVCTGVPGQTYEADLDPVKCQANCQALPNLGDLNVERDQFGDSLQCRLVHVSEASTSRTNAVNHCLHTQTVPRGAGSFPCSDPDDITPDENCTKYCTQVMGACSGEYAMYKDAAQCKAVCLLLEQGNRGDQTENTVRCRRYHTYNALDEGPGLHCAHSGPTGDGHCGENNCQSYCLLASKACPVAFAAAGFASTAACEQSCQALPGANIDNFRDFDPHYSVNAPAVGNNVLCRTFHAVNAAGLALPNDPTECPAALGAPGSACSP